MLIILVYSYYYLGRKRLTLRSILWVKLVTLIRSGWYYYSGINSPAKFLTTLIFYTVFSFVMSRSCRGYSFFRILFYFFTFYTTWKCSRTYLNLYVVWHRHEILRYVSYHIGN